MSTRRVRPGQRRAETLCTVCEQLVGLVNLRWNGDDDRRAKTSRHHDRDGRWCAGGQLAVDAARVVEIPVGVRVTADTSPRRGSATLPTG